jgi:hypothetical protein
VTQGATPIRRDNRSIELRRASRKSQGIHRHCRGVGWLCRLIGLRWIDRQVQQHNMSLIPQTNRRGLRSTSTTLVFLTISVCICLNLWFLYHYGSKFETKDSDVQHHARRREQESDRQSTAHKIILRAYQETYSLLVDYCHPDMMLQQCMSKLYNSRYEDLAKSDFFLSGKNNYLSSEDVDPYAYNPASAINKLRKNPPPWWFFTMLRDGSAVNAPMKRDNITYTNGGLFGLWHEAVAENPNISMCLIEKVANSQWRKVFFEMNGAREPGATKKMPFLPQRYKPGARVKLPMPKATYPTFIFLRDPLERFLSAYMDKCFKTLHRGTHQHCEPNLLHDNPSTRDTLMKGLYDVKDGAVVRKKEAFEMYVDTVPLRWNMHFFPQSLYCNGLYRSLDDYDFVGTMGPDFYKDIDEVAHRYGGRFEKEVHKVFDADKHVEEDTVNHGVETSAPKFVKEFYSPRSLRRVLEFVSIDYVFLGLPVPQWAHEILAEEEAEFDVSTTFRL